MSRIISEELSKEFALVLSHQLIQCQAPDRPFYQKMFDELAQAPLATTLDGIQRWTTEEVAGMSDDVDGEDFGPWLREQDVYTTHNAGQVGDWPCQDLLGGNPMLAGANEYGRCKHPECNPINDDRTTQPQPARGVPSHIDKGAEQ